MKAINATCKKVKEDNGDWLNDMYNDTLMDMYEYFKDEINDSIEYGDIDDCTDEIFEDEWNWNNGDKTSGQFGHTKEAISGMLDDLLTLLLKDSDRCQGCGRKRQDDDYLSESEPRPYGNGVAYESVSVGYRCSKCGYGEDY